jgi:TolB-like protein
LGVGITEDLRDLLWHFPEFQVVSGTSSVGSGNSPENLRDIARKFGAQFVLEGTVRRTGDKAVITAQLIDGATDVHLWSTRFEEPGSDPVALEKATAEKLAGSLGGLTGKMRQAYERIAWSKAEADLTEYDYYVRGHTHQNRFTQEESERAREIYLAGLDRFPASALLRIKMAFTHNMAVWFGWSQDPRADLTQFGKLVAEAAELLAARRPSPFEEWYLHWASHYKYWFERDFSHCMAEAQATVALAPYDAFVRADVADGMARCGNPKEAVEWAKQATRLDPAGPPSWPAYYAWTLAWVSYLAGEYQAAASVIQGMADADKPLMILAACYIQLGRLDEARSTMASFVKSKPDWTLKDEEELLFQPIESLRQRWLDDLRAAGLPDG